MGNIVEKIENLYSLAEQVSNYSGKNVKQTKVYKEFEKTKEELRSYNLNGLEVISLLRNPNLIDLNLEKSQKYKDLQEVCRFLRGPPKT